MTKKKFASLLHLGLLFVLLAGFVFQPQYPAYAAANMSVTPITWNVVGLDSNNVNVGPNNFPVGVRVCNTSTASETLNNLTATFVWDDGQVTDPYINLRTGSQNPITFTGLAAGGCKGRIRRHGRRDSGFPSPAWWHNRHGSSFRRERCL